MDEWGSQLAAALQLHGSRRYVEAESVYRELTTSRPHDARVSHLLGLLLHEQGRNDEALPLLAKAIELAPAEPQHHANLGSVLVKLGRGDDAVAHLQRAVELNPAYAEAHNSLGVIASGRGDFALAESEFQAAIDCRPSYREAHNNLGAALRKMGRPRAALDSHLRALSLDLRDATAYGGMAAAYLATGRQQEALEARRRAIELRPQDVGSQSALLMVLTYAHGDVGEDIYSAHVQWGQSPLGPKSIPTPVLHPHVRSEDRALRVGFISPDFRDHPAARCLEPILAHLNPDETETYAYSDVARPDAVTARLRQRISAWRNTTHLSDATVMEQVAADRLDVLVDLAGHFANNRTRLFNFRLAPVQVNHYVCPTTSGATKMDYRVTDDLSDPPGMTEKWHTEKLVRLLPNSWCYDPAPGGSEWPCVAPAPAGTNGYTTFGCLNNPAKSTPRILRAWAEVLRQVPRSSLLLLGSIDGNDHVVGKLTSHGVASERVEFMPFVPRAAYLRAFERIDVALDPFPYNGCTTSCDALWMGVPLVTMAGPTYISRQGTMLLSNVGSVAGRVTEDDAAYVDTAVELAGLSSDGRRRELRDAFEASPIMRFAQFATRLQKLWWRLHNQAEYAR